MISVIQNLPSTVMRAPRRLFDWYMTKSAYARWGFGLILGIVGVVLPAANAITEHSLGRSLFEIVSGTPQPVPTPTRSASAEKQNVQGLLKARTRKRKIASQPHTYIDGSATSTFNDRADVWQIRADVDSNDSYFCEVRKGYGYGTLTVRAHYVYFLDAQDFARHLSLFVTHQRIPGAFSVAGARVRIDETQILHTAFIADSEMVVEIDPLTEQQIREGRYLRLTLLPMITPIRPGMSVLSRSIELKSVFNLKYSKRALTALDACGDSPETILDGQFYPLAA